MSQKLDKNVLLVSFVFYLSVFMPFVTYCIIKLYRNRHEIYMRKRHLRLLLCSIICCITFTTKNVIFDTEACFVHQICVSNLFSHPQDFELSHLILMPLLISFTLRVWILYYDLRWNEIVLNMEWWSHIKEQPMNQHWILKYKNSLGTCNKRTCKYVILYLVILLVSITLLSHFDLEAGNYISTLHVTISLIVTVIILCKVRVFDAFRIRFELNVHMTVWSFTCIYFVITESFDLPGKYAFFAYARSWVHIFVCMIICHISILYPINYFKKHQNLILKDVVKLHINVIPKLHAQLADKSSTQSTTNAESDFKTEAQNISKSWTDYCCVSATNFNNFMQNLVSEMSVENLAFMLEISQLKAKYANDSVYDNGVGEYIRFPSDLPVSSIVERSKDLPKQILLFYNKYIIDSAELQLNLSYAIRQEIEENISKLQATETHEKNLLFIYDDAVMEVTRLLFNSFTRFKLKAEFVD
eukprot:277863_1